MGPGTGAFEDPEVTHVEDTVDPIRDLEIITQELRLKVLFMQWRASNGWIGWVEVLSNLLLCKVFDLRSSVPRLFYFLSC